MPTAQELDDATYQDDTGDDQEARHDGVLDDENGPSYGTVSALVLRPISPHVFFHLYEGYRGLDTDALPLTRGTPNSLFRKWILEIT